MIELTIDTELKEKCPDTVIGCVQANVVVEASPRKLLTEVEEYCDKLNGQYKIEQVPQLPIILASRQAYKALGKDPNRYRVSSEALLRRVLQGKGLYQVNNIVEINNLISLKSLWSVGTYNLAMLKGPLTFAVGKQGETYKGIGKDHVNIENLPVLADDMGKVGSPSSDSERAMITKEAKQILMCIYAFGGKWRLEEYMAEAKTLLEKYANGTEIKTKVIE